jgi:antitoxin YefM
MYTLYRLNADDLNERFLESLRALFQGKDIEISVCETADQTDDETAYLLRSPANRKRLMEAIANVSQVRRQI